MSIQNNKKGLPVVAVVGRPNVGKSTLFNRLIGKRQSITDSTPGVTRDPVEGIYDLGHHKVKLIDTGGFKVDQTGLDEQVTNKSLSVLEGADLIVFLMDVTETTGEDEAFAKILRKYSDKILLVVNKVDSEKREADVWNYYSYGFDNVVGVSAAHGIGISEFIDKLEELIDFEAERAVDEIAEPDIRIALLGKPNTGKSTLINRLLEKDVAIVSDIPGTTRDVIEGRFKYKHKVYRVLDTAGIRKKKKVGENVEYYSVNRAIKTIEHSDVVLLMIDAVEGLGDQDKKIATQIVKKGCGVVLVLNKWDMVKEIPNQMEAIQDRTKFLFPVLSFAPLVPLSAVTGEGVDNLFKQVYKVWNQLNHRVDTSTLNSALKRWVERTEPPRFKGGRYKILYGTQVSSNPVKFILFINKKRGFPESYLQYIKNNIRSELGFSSIPLEVELKER